MNLVYITDCSIIPTMIEDNPAIKIMSDDYFPSSFRIIDCTSDELVFIKLKHPEVLLKHEFMQDVQLRFKYTFEIQNLKTKFKS